MWRTIVLSLVMLLSPVAFGQWLQNVTATVAPNSATVTWTSCTPATSSAKYGLTSSYGSTAGGSSALVTSHSVILTNLVPSTLYHFYPLSTDSTGALVSGGSDYTFTTGPPTQTISITVSPSPVTVVSGGTQQFTATVTGTTNTAVTWNTTLGTVSSSGLFGAPVVTASTLAVVTATSVADNTKSFSVKATVTPTTPPVCVLPGVLVNNVCTCPPPNTLVGGVCTAPQGQSNILFVNAVGGTDQSSVSLKSIATAPISQTSGNANVVFVKCGTNATTSATVTDKAGNVYAPIRGLQPGNGGAAQQFVAKNIIGIANNVITATFSAPVAFPTIRVREYSGLDQTAPLDVSDGVGGNLPLTSNPFTTSFANELVVVGFTSNNGSPGFTAGPIGGVTATNLGSTADSGDEDLIVSNVQTGITAAMNAKFGSAGMLLTATFKAAGGGPPPPPTCPAPGVLVNNVCTCPPPNTLVGGVCTAPVGIHSVTLQWNASLGSAKGKRPSPPTVKVGAQPKHGKLKASLLTYNMYRSVVSGSGYVKLSTTPITTLTYTDTSVVSGTTYYYVVTTVDATRPAGSQESVFSNQAQAVIPTP